MSRVSKILLFVALNLAVPFFVGGCVTSLPEAKSRVMAYYEDGRYEQAVAKVLKEAEQYLPAAGSYNAVGSAVVFDIDDTVLSTYEYQKALGFGHSGRDWHKWLELGRGTAIRPALAFYLLAKERGLAVFFVTGRREQFRSITEENLKRTGFKDWQGLYMKPAEFKGKSVIDLKVSRRQAIEKLGYKIILNVGDQKSDLAGGHALHSVLLPNLIYEVN